MPYYIRAGMSPKDYWEGDPYLTIVYRKVEERRIKETNEFLWLQGKYVLDAMDVAIHNRFSKKGTTPLEYPKEPYRITPPTEEEKKAKAEAERQKAIKSLTAWKQAWDRQNG